MRFVERIPVAVPGLRLGDGAVATGAERDDVFAGIHPEPFEHAVEQVFDVVGFPVFAAVFDVFELALPAAGPTAPAPSACGGTSRTGAL